MSTVEELQSELAELRAEMRAMREQLTTPAAPARVVSRRNLLRVVPMTAIGAGIAALSVTPAAADAGQPLLMGENNHAPGRVTFLNGGDPPFSYALEIDGGIYTDVLDVANTILSDSTQGIVINPTSAASVEEGNEGVLLNAYTRFPFENPADTIVTGEDGLTIKCWGPGNGLTVNQSDQVKSPTVPHSAGTAAVLSSVSGNVLALNTDSGHALVAEVRSATTTLDAATVSYAGTGRAVYAESTATTNINGTVTGVNAGNGIGVWGEQRGTGAGFGLVGVAGKTGRGARVSGGAAGLQILPSTAATHPTSGKAGDFFVDASARLWYCQKTSTTAATWKQLA